MNTWKTGAFSLLAFGVVVLYGCDSLRQEVNPDRLNRESAKLVVNCFLSPQDTVLAVKVTRSLPVLGDGTGATAVTGTNVVDATVTISDGARSVSLKYDNTQFPRDAAQPFYSVDARQLPIVAGHTYKLTVRTPAGEIATSTCTVPGAVIMTGVSFDSLDENQFGRKFKRYFVRSRWTDPAGQINYYQVSGLFRFVRLCQNCPANQADREEFNYLNFSDNTASLQTDRSSDGSSMISGRGFLGGYFENGGNSSPNFGRQYKKAIVTINLLNTDQAYYQYQDAIERQNQSGDNPFAEPVLIPTNVQGGLGCFAGYNRSTLTINLK